MKGFLASVGFGISFGANGVASCLLKAAILSRKELVFGALSARGGSGFANLASCFCASDAGVVLVSTTSETHDRLPVLVLIAADGESR